MWLFYSFSEDFIMLYSDFNFSGEVVIIPRENATGTVLTGSNAKSMIIRSKQRGDFLTTILFNSW